MCIILPFLSRLLFFVRHCSRLSSSSTAPPPSTIAPSPELDTPQAPPWIRLIDPTNFANRLRARPRQVRSPPQLRLIESARASPEHGKPQTPPPDPILLRRLVASSPDSPTRRKQSYP